MDDNLLTVDQMCDWLMISRSTLVRWRKNGLPSIKVSKSVRFDKEEVKKWLKEQNKLI